MEIHELTEEQSDKVIEGMIKMLGRERKFPSKKELEEDIIDYLSKRQPCALATCGKDGMPRISVVEYMNDGLTIYIMSLRGIKFNNIKENNHVAIGIGTSTGTMRSVRGVNIWGIAKVFTDDTPEFAHGMRLFRPFFLEDNEKAIGAPIEFPKGMMKMIRVIPTKMVYNQYNKGIANAHWKAK